MTVISKGWDRLTLPGKIVFTAVPLLIALTVGLVVGIVLLGPTILDILEANLEALRAGWNFGETTEEFGTTYVVAPAAMLIPYQATAPVLIVVGFLMFSLVKDIDVTGVEDGLPALLTMILMPLTVSITEGIAFGFIAYAVLKLATGRAREAHPLVYLFSGLFVARYVWL